MEKDLGITIDEIRAFRKEILLMHGLLANDIVQDHTVLQKVSAFFINKGLNKLWLDKFLSPFLGSEIAEDEELLLLAVLEELDSHLLTEQESEPIEKKIRILIGATGVGKTTFVGKLGARYAYFLKKSYNVAFCNNDKLKLGAVEQLRHYSDAMDIPMIELENLLEESSYDIILVDTAGIRADNISELSEWIRFLDMKKEYRVEVSLVLSATQRFCNMVDIMGLFSDIEIDNFVFTKLDETRDIGDMMNFLIEHQKPISYLSIGQKIPEDLMVATNEYILNKFMIERGNSE